MVLMVTLIACGGLILALSVFLGHQQLVERRNRYFLMVSPLPVILSLVIPLVLGLLSNFSTQSRPYIVALSQIALLFSAVLGVLGIMLAFWAHTREEKKAVTVGTLLSLIPLAMVAAPYAVMR